ncbi:MAG TPA: hypothetical protein VGO07_01180 [Candidatus Saccharimonadales bacterium]|jgi:hypothetical protein|nr:hypothetical protein [Candidatus Saccharimonadales bacterium]
MTQKTQNFSEQHSFRARKAAQVVVTLRFLWRQSRLLPRELEKARLQPVPQALLDAYDANRSVIEAIYGSDHIRRGLLYHGTGALQYDGDKYGAGMTGGLRRPIDAILGGGLSPHTDPWALTQGSMQSTSFATAWSYAKFYADVYQTPDDPLEWEYGNGADWFSYFIADTAGRTFKKALAAGSLRKGLRTLRKTQEQNVNANGYNRLQRWAFDLRSDITPQTSTLDVICARTDIPGNFGAIITVSEDDMLLAPMGLGGTYEKRAARTVGPEEFISLAVPLNKVDEYSAKVHGLGYSFPVLPTEAVEYHMSHFPIQELAHAQRVM